MDVSSSQSQQHWSTGDEIVRVQIYLTNTETQLQAWRKTIVNVSFYEIQHANSILMGHTYCMTLCTTVQPNKLHSATKYLGSAGMILFVCLTQFHFT